MLQLQLNYMVQLVTSGIKVFEQEIQKRVQSDIANGLSLSEAWAKIPEKLAFMTTLETTQLRVVYSVQDQW